MSALRLILISIALFILTSSSTLIQEMFDETASRKRKRKREEEREDQQNFSKRPHRVSSWLFHEMNNLKRFLIPLMHARTLYHEKIINFLPEQLNNIL